jgi:nitrogen-specific signal transduction histidine kinase
MNSELNSTSGTPVVTTSGSVILDSSDVQAMRHRLHELANVITGIMIAGGLLSQQLEPGSLQHYASNVSEGGERCCVLVRELRSQLLTDGSVGDSVDAPKRSQKIS